MRYEIKHLFSELGWHSVVENQKRTVRREVENYSSLTFKEASIEELKEKLLEKYSLTAPVINPEAVDVSQREIDIERSSDYGFQHRSRYVKGTEVVVRIPFTGDKEMFRVQPLFYREQNLQVLKKTNPRFHGYILCTPA